MQWASNKLELQESRLGRIWDIGRCQYHQYPDLQVEGGQSCQSLYPHHSPAATKVFGLLTLLLMMARTQFTNSTWPWCQAIVAATHNLSEEGRHLQNVGILIDSPWALRAPLPCPTDVPTRQLQENINTVYTSANLCCDGFRHMWAFEKNETASRLAKIGCRYPQPQSSNSHSEANKLLKQKFKADWLSKQDGDHIHQLSWR